MVRSSHFNRYTIYIVLAILTMTLCSCAQFSNINSPVLNVQPGDYFSQNMLRKNLTTKAQIMRLVNQTRFIGYESKAYWLENVDDTVILLQSISKTRDVSQAVLQLSETKPDKVKQWVHLSLILYPADAFQIFDALHEDSRIKEEILQTAALLAGLDPSYIYPPAAAAEGAEYRIVPLIHSASLTLYEQTEDTRTRLYYKLADSETWLLAFGLQWVPTLNALSGSIVHLNADSNYDIKVEFLVEEEVKNTHFYNFQTRANTPPIDPNKVYYLSDIYSGGQLDLSALGIEGSETGWAKIIGDGTEIMAAPDDYSAINIGSQSYIFFENIVVKGGNRYAIYAKYAHHIWIKGCDVSHYGRVGTDIRDGVAYENPESINPINYDSGIYLHQTGVVTVEDCEVHSPNGKANNWESGHPNGPNAMLVYADHPVEEFRGQYIIRNNRFYGTHDKRFNDVIEGRSNFYTKGSFGRDSAIYGNYFAYANDDIIEFDGGQSNVLFYNNELTQGFCGVSVAPNMTGPSYIFNNYIHDLGDDRGTMWTAIKMGGLLSRPGGVTNVFENLIYIKRNGIASARVAGDATYWVNAQNNIIINQWTSGYGILDSELYVGSTFYNNLISNTATLMPSVVAVIGDDFYHPWSEQEEKINEMISTGPSVIMELESRFIIPNFSNVVLAPAQSVDISHEEKSVDFESAQFACFARNRPPVSVQSGH